GVGQGGVLAHVTPRHHGQALPGYDQAGLAEQLGRPYGQQLLVARARPGQRDPPMFLTTTHCTSLLFLLLDGACGTLMRSEAPDRSSSAARSRPSWPPSAAAAVPCARRTRLPSRLMTAACIRSWSAPAAYAPMGALQP